MAMVEARVGTPRAARYVEQLSSHFGHQPGGMKVLSSAPGELLIDLGEATWSIRALENELVLQVHADDPDHLRETSAHVGARIEQIGRRDGLQVRWRTGE
ncbi:DUF2218 domain-containing protein [Kribbella sp. NPDC026596]|uniref:DUF2218 domain-containing protein n=1 Tax=Kribbella sp. NPDC026596 TaxID=3155122 RepID=UPI0033C20E19